MPQVYPPKLAHSPNRPPDQPYYEPMPQPPRRKTEWKDEYTLLCERCGYIIDDLDHSLPCPECSKLISESLPERRVGTPWQNNRSMRSALKTWADSLLRPHHTLRLLRVDAASHGFRELSFLAASSLLTVASFLFRWRWKLMAVDGEQLTSTVWSKLISHSILTGVGLYILLTLLTATEQYGLVLFGKRHKTRLNKATARVICDHASAGWVFAATGTVIGSGVVVVSTNDLSTPFNETHWLENGLMFYLFIIGHGLAAISIILGFLFFETFAFLGLRRCKYANRPRPIDHPQPPKSDPRSQPLRTDMS